MPLPPLLILLACGAGALSERTEEPMSRSAAPLSLDGTGDWAGLLSTSTPAEAAAAAAALAQGAVVLTPQDPAVLRLPPEAQAKITAPAVDATPDGVRTLRFWMGQPPGFGPVQVEVRVPAEGPAQVSRTPLDSTLGAAEQEAMLLRSLADGSRKEKQQAARLLGERRSAAAVPGLLALLGDAYAPARADAAEALGHIGDPSAVPGLGAALAQEADLSAGMKMVEALGRIGGPQAKAALEQAAGALSEPTLAMKAREAAAGL